MSFRKEFYFLSADGITQIHVNQWDSAEKPVGVVQIAHGISEYAQRYEPLAEFLNRSGFVVFANDHIGHGLSVAEGAARICFGEENGWQYVVDDMHTLHGQIKRDYPDLPCFLLGHSMGSFLVRTYLIRYPEEADGAIIMGTGQQAALNVLVGKRIAEHEIRRKGYESYSPLIGKLAFSAYNTRFAPNRTEFDWLSANPDNVDSYIADPLCGSGSSIGLFRDMIGGIGYIENKENLRRMNPDTPVLFVSGALDPVGDMGKGVKKAFASFKDAGVREVSIKLYEGLRHEILNERCDTVYQDLLAWLQKHL